MAESASSIRCVFALLRRCTARAPVSAELTWPGGVSRSPPSPDMCKALTSPPSPHRHSGRPRTGRPASRHRLEAFARRLFSLLAERKATASARLRRTGRPRYRHPLSLALSPILLLSRLPFTAVHLARAGRDCGGTAGVTCPAAQRNTEERAGGGEEKVVRKKLDLDLNHNLRRRKMLLLRSQQL